MNTWLRTAPCVLLLGLLASGPSQAQQIAQAGPSCVLEAGEYTGDVYVPPLAKSQRYLDLLEIDPNARSTSTIDITWLGAGDTDPFGFPCIDAPADAVTAFDTAASIWEALLESTPVIEVTACWSAALPAGVLGVGGALTYTTPGGGIPGTFYQAALANAIDGVDLSPGTDEIANTFNSTFTWDFVMDPPPGPGGAFDFITVVLHELGHGLGFAGSAEFGSVCGGASDGCLGLGPGPSSFTTVYDAFVDDGSGVSLLTYANPSAALGSVLTGGNPGSIFFDGAVATSTPPAGPKDLHSPAVWAGGSSYSHFDSSVFGSELMSPSIAPAVAIYDPGLALAAMDDEGWSIKPPVELTSFTGTANGNGVMLRWETSSETNNAGFDVEMRGSGDEAFSSAGFVEGHGTTTEEQSYTFQVEALSPGTYTFRLHQHDFDGRSELSPAVEVMISVPDGYMLAAPYPNPFNPEAVVEFAVAESRPVRIELFNALGQNVALLFEGMPEAGETQRVHIDGGALPSGTYIVRLSGENILATQRVTLLK